MNWIRYVWAWVQDFWAMFWNWIMRIPPPATNGFEITIRVAPGTDVDAFDRQFIAEVERLGLCFGGIVGWSWLDGWMYAARSQTTTADREAVLDWLWTQREVTYVKLGPLLTEDEQEELEAQRDLEGAIDAARYEEMMRACATSRA